MNGAGNELPEDFMDSDGAGSDLTEQERAERTLKGIGMI